MKLQPIEIMNDVVNVNIGVKEEKKLQEGSEVASQSSVSRTETNEVSIQDYCVLLFMVNES
jgi:hypothetical protein